MFSNKLRLLVLGIAVTFVVVVILLFSRHTYFYKEPDLKTILDPIPGLSTALSPVAARR